MVSRRRPVQLTTTSYALLGLLAVKDWTTYELAGQMDRGLGTFWPRARSKVFEEPKKLVALGVAKAKRERVGARSRTVYSITPAGRKALRAWMKKPSEPPFLEWEQLVKVFFAENGTKTDLLGTLDAVGDWAAEQRRRHRDRARSYLDGEGLFPERTQITVLTGSFLADFAVFVGDWAAKTRKIVDGWPEDIGKAEPDWTTLETVARYGRTTAGPGRS